MNNVDNKGHLYTSEFDKEQTMGEICWFCILLVGFPKQLAGHSGKQDSRLAGPNGQQGFYLVLCTLYLSICALGGYSLHALYPHLSLTCTWS